MYRLVVILSLLFAGAVFAEDMVIFDVRHNIRLDDNEPRYRDYYINAGSQRGLKKGQVFKVTRSISLYDAYQNRSPGDLAVEVAEIEIIYSQDQIAVARDHQTLDRKKRPLLDNDFVMIGDRIDPSSAKPAQN